MSAGCDGANSEQSPWSNAELFRVADSCLLHFTVCTRRRIIPELQVLNAVDETNFAESAS